MGCHFLLQCMKVKIESEVAQSYPTLHDPMDCSLPGSSIHGIFQARVLEWVPLMNNIPILAFTHSLKPREIEKLQIFFSATHFLVYKEFTGILKEKSNFTVLIYMSMTLREILPIKEFSFNFHRNGKSNCSSDLLQLPLLFHSSRFSFI